MEKALKKFNRSSHTRLTLFQMLPSSKLGHQPLMHLVLSDNSPVHAHKQQLYWQVRDVHTMHTLYFTVDHDSDIPASYHQISDGHNRSAVFATASELSSKNEFQDGREVVLLPTRDRRTDYWFRLRMRPTRLVYELMGDVQVVPLQKQTKSSSKEKWFLRQLPFGFIHGNKVSVRSYML